MRKVEVTITAGTAKRLERIRTLRHQAILTDEEIFIASVSAYWLALEQPDRKRRIQKMD